MSNVSILAAVTLAILGAGLTRLDQRSIQSRKGKQSMDDKRWRLNDVFGCYLGLSDIVTNAKKENLPIYWEYVEKRLMELRLEHDRINQESSKCHS